MLCPTKKGKLKENHLLEAPDILLIAILQFPCLYLEHIENTNKNKNVRTLFNTRTSLSYYSSYARMVYGVENEMKTVQVSVFNLINGRH